MKKAYIIGGIILAVVVVVAVLFTSRNSSAPSGTNKSSFTTYDACQLLTEQKAKEVLGTATVLSEESAPASTDALKVTNCTYNNDTGNFQTLVSASVLVRSPLNQEGVESNQQTFTMAETVGEETVSGYGEKAMWSNATGQLNVLKDNNWIIITYGKGTPSSRTLEETKALANKIFQ